MSLPSGYKRLEYIRSSGTQYVDTLFNPTQNTQLVLDAAFLGSAGTNVAGVRNNSIDTTNRFGIISFGSASKLGAFFRDSSIQAVTFDNNRHLYDLSKDGLVCDGTSYGGANTGSFACTYSLTLFAWNNGADGVTCNLCEVYSCQIYDNGTIVRNYIPCQTTAGEIGLWDDVNSVFYGNAGTGTFTAGPVIAIAVAVSEVTELEYIQSSGEQYVNTGVSSPIGFRITCDVLLTSIANTLNMLFGSHDAASPYYRNFLAATSGGKWEIGAYNPYDFGTAAINTRYAIDVCTISGEVSCTINGSAQSIDTSIAASTVRSSRSIYVFALNYPDGLFQASMELCTLQIYLDAGKTNLVRDYMAAKLSDGTVGLYDKLNGLLYINVGTGSFTAGPEVQKAPTTPTGFTAAAITDTTVQLNWTASDGATGYKLYKNSDLLATLTETSYVDTVQAFSGTAYSITAYNDDGESEAAALTYYAAPENPILYLVTDRTAEDVDAGNDKGTYKASDLNRVGAAMNYVAARLREQGYDPHISPKTDWKDDDWVDPAAQAVYLVDLAELRKQFTLYETTPEVPPRILATAINSGDGLTYAWANDIEQILMDIDALLTNIAAGWIYSGEIYSGEV